MLLRTDFIGYKGPQKLIGSFIIVAVLCGVARNLAEDCNNNGQDDASDIANGLAADCNDNGVPDVCEGFPLELGLDKAAHELTSVPRVLAAADLDDDGDLDLVAGSKGTQSGSRIFVLLNRGRDGFAAIEEYAAGKDLFSLTTADLDRDGRPEVISANDRALLVFANDGAGALAAPISIDTADGTRFVTAADLDGDGAPEILAASREVNSIAVFKSTGDGALVASSNHLAGSEPWTMSVADFDADGHPDLAVVNRESHTLSFFRNNGAGNFEAAVHRSAGGELPSTIAVGDLDTDGHPDLAVMTAAGIAIHINDGNGQLVASTLLPGSGAGLDIIDIDGDGDLDLALGTINPVGLTLILNDGAGNFVRTISRSTGRVPNDLVSGDFDGDGDLDVALTSTSPSSIFLLWKGVEASLSLTRETVPLSGCNNMLSACLPHSGALADFDGDGDLDMAGISNFPGTVSIALNRGDGHLEQVGNQVFGGASHLAAVAGDLDGNGTMDIATIDNVDSHVTVLLGRGDASFAFADVVEVDSAPIDIALADINGDDDLDVITANQTGNTISLLFNRGDGTLLSTGGRDVRVRTGPRSLATADFDGDGDIDIAVANASSTDISVLTNDGNGGFGGRIDYGLGEHPSSIEAGDFDNDGDLDLIAASADDTSATVFLNSGSGAFNRGGRFEIGQAPTAITSDDFDGDGRLDLFTANEISNTVSILLGSGAARFGTPVHFEVGRGVRHVYTGDLDNDGAVDIVTADRLGKSFTVLRQLEERPTPPTHRERICTPGEFHGLSIRPSTSGSIVRFIKFIMPVREDPELLPILFQNTASFPLHEDFLTAVFPERFAALDSREYIALVGKRSTREYFAGIISFVLSASGPLYGFDVFADFTTSTERLTVEEVRELHRRLGEMFALQPLVYAPSSGAAIEVASQWQEAGFPVYLDGLDTTSTFEAYTRGIGYGRVRMLTPAELEEANSTGLLSFQDILVLSRAPRDLEGIVGGVLTAVPQGELSHLIVRTARRGTPNAFAMEALEVMEPHVDKLVRLEVTETEFLVRPADIAEATAFWESNRPQLARLPGVDPETNAILDLEELGQMIELEGEHVAVSRYGGKAVNFAKLQAILTGEQSRYRELGFAIPVHYYLEFMSSNTLTSAFDDDQQVTYDTYLEELFESARFQSDGSFRREALEELQEHMEENGVVSANLVTRLAVEVAGIFASTNDRVRMRSSSTVEDALEFNGAGLYASTSACAADDLDGNDSGPSRCDQSIADERGMARALRRVWASLWNYRAVEERSFFGIPRESAAMGILVTRTFVGEEVNGVAFTGNPSNPCDRRLVIISQVGETSVVSPPAGTVAAKDLLEIAGGSVTHITRIRGSSLLPDGQQVLDEARLLELGELLSFMETNFPIELDGHSRDRVLLDVEFKVDSENRLAIKQIRPFLSDPGAAPCPTFQLEVPRGMSACGAFVIDREPLEEYSLKSTLRFREGLFTLPSAQGSIAANLVEELLLGPDQETATPLEPGRFTTSSSRSGTEVTFLFRYRQRFQLTDGTELAFELGPVGFTVAGDEPRDGTRVLDSTLLDAIAGGLHGESDGLSMDVRYAPCDTTDLPRWEVRAGLEDGSDLRLEERFLPALNRDYGPATLVRAELDMGGEQRLVTDYWHLVYTSIRHNLAVRYLIVLDHPITRANLAGEVHAVELAAPEPRLEFAGHVLLLGPQFEVLEKLELTSYDKHPLDDQPVRFQRGDINADGDLNLTDAVVLLEYLFRAGTRPTCEKAADVDDRGDLNLTDAIRLLMHLFQGADPPPPPFDACGEDRTADMLECAAFAPCEG